MISIAIIAPAAPSSLTFDLELNLYPKRFRKYLIHDEAANSMCNHAPHHGSRIPQDFARHLNARQPRFQDVSYLLD